MKNEDILNALNYLPDEMIEKAAKGRHGYGKEKVTVATRFMKPALAAASVAVIFGISIFAMSHFGNGIDGGTADEALPELSPSREEMADADAPLHGIFDAPNDFFEATTSNTSSNEKTTDALAPNTTVNDMSSSDAADTYIEIESGLSDKVLDEITTHLYFSENGITLETKKGSVLSEIDLREHLDSAQISVGGITLNHSEKNLAKVNDLLTVIEKSPIISRGKQLTESEDDCMATLYFYISEGWSLAADAVHEPVRVAIELLFGSCVRISVDGFDPIYISVSEEALIEFTNGLEYLVTND